MIICAPQMGLPPDSHLGGAVYDREVLRGLAQLGHQVLIPLPQGEAYERLDGWQIIPTPRPWRYTYEAAWLFWPAVHRLWQEKRFDLFRVHTAGLGLLGWWVKKRLGVPVTGHFHHLDAREALKNLVTRLVIDAYNLVTTLSEFSAGQLRARYGSRLPPVAILPPGVDEALQPAAADPGVRQRWLGDNHHTLFFYLGVLAARKDLPTLLRGLALARRADPGLALLIGGVGPLEGELRALITALGLDGHAFLAGLIPPEHKAAYFNSADAFVFPSRLEGFGIAPAEAMACGRPVLAARAASLPEVIGEAGLYFEPGSPQALAEGLLILAHDPALRQRLGQAGRERVRTCFSWPRTAQQTAAAYQEVIQAAQEQRTP